MHLTCLSILIGLVLYLFHFVNSKKLVALDNHIKLQPFKNKLQFKKHKLGKKLNFIFDKKKKNRYELKNLENVPLYVITNEFDQVILSFNLDKDSKKKKKSNNSNGSNNSNSNSLSEYNEHFYDVSWGNNTFLLPLVKNKEKSRREINLDNIHNNNCICVFFFDKKVAEAYKEDMLHSFNKNLKEKKIDKLFFGSKVKLTNLQYFFKIKNSYNSKIDFVLIPNYMQLQNVLKNKKFFHGTPIYYINKIKLHKSLIKKNFYKLFYKNIHKETKVELSLNAFMTYTVKEEETHSSLIIELEVDKKRYIPVFFSFEQANSFYKKFLKHFKNNFYEYCLPKPNIILNSFENLLIISKLANDQKINHFYNIFFIPSGNTFGEACYDGWRCNFFVLYINKIYQKFKYDLFRSFRKNLNTLVSDYLYG